MTSIQHGGSVTLVSLGGENSANGASRTDQVKYININCDILEIPSIKQWKDI